MRQQPFAGTGRKSVRKITATAAAAVAAGLVAGLPGSASAVDRYYTGASGFWGTSTNWNTIEGGGGSTGIPNAGDNVFIRGSISKNVTLNVTYATAIGPMQIGSSSGATLTLFQNSNSLLGGDEYVGYDGNGIYNQSAGTNDLTSNFLYSGYNAGSTGNYTLSGTGILNDGEAMLGHFGSATFTQSGGTHTTSNLLMAEQTI
jgi:hypothetical protein